MLVACVDRPPMFIYYIKMKHLFGILIICLLGYQRCEAVTCPPGTAADKTDTDIDHCYLLYSGVLKWEVSSNVCQSLDGALVQPETSMQSDLLETFMVDKGLQSMWIGAELVETGWNWPDQSGLGTYQPWKTSLLEQQATDSSRCVGVSPVDDWQWVILNCNVITAFYMCQTSDLPCSSTSTADAYQVGSLCYTFHKESKNWFSAASSCRSNNGQLAIIYSEEMYDEMKEKFSDVEVPHFWLGLRKDSWLWSTGSVIEDYEFTPSSELSQPCIVLARDEDDFYWDTRDCEDMNPYTCQIGPETATAAPLASGGYPVATAPPSISTPPNNSTSDASSTGPRTGVTIGLIILMVMLVFILGGIILLFFCYYRRGKKLTAKARAEAPGLKKKYGYGESRENPAYDPDGVTEEEMIGGHLKTPGAFVTSAHTNYPNGVPPVGKYHPNSQPKMAANNGDARMESIVERSSEYKVETDMSARAKMATPKATPKLQPKSTPNGKRRENVYSESPSSTQHLYEDPDNPLVEAQSNAHVYSEVNHHKNPPYADDYLEAVNPGENDPEGSATEDNLDFDDIGGATGGLDEDAKKAERERRRRHKHRKHRHRHHSESRGDKHRNDDGAHAYENTTYEVDFDGKVTDEVKDKHRHHGHRKHREKDPSTPDKPVQQDPFEELSSTIRNSIEEDIKKKHLPPIGTKEHRPPKAPGNADDNTKTDSSRDRKEREHKSREHRSRDRNRSADPRRRRNSESNLLENSDTESVKKIKVRSNSVDRREKKRKEKKSLTREGPESTLDSSWQYGDADKLKKSLQAGDKQIIKAFFQEFGDDDPKSKKKANPKVFLDDNLEEESMEV